MLLLLFMLFQQAKGRGSFHASVVMAIFLLLLYCLTFIFHAISMKIKPAAGVGSLGVIF